MLAIQCCARFTSLDLGFDSGRPGTSRPGTSSTPAGSRPLRTAAPSSTKPTSRSGKLPSRSIGRNIRSPQTVSTKPHPLPPPIRAASHPYLALALLLLCLFLFLFTDVWTPANELKPDLFFSLSFPLSFSVSRFLGFALSPLLSLSTVQAILASGSSAVPDTAYIKSTAWLAFEWLVRQLRH